MKNPYSNIPIAIWLLATVTLISRTGSMVIIFLSLYLTQKLGFNILATGKILGFYGLGEIAGSYLGGVFADRIGYFKVQTVSLLATGVLYLFLQALYTSVAIMSALFFIGLLVASIRPATNANITHFSTPEIRARTYALNYQAVNLGFCLGSSLGGLLITANYSWLFIADGSASIIAAIVFWSFFRNKTAVTTQITKSSASQNQLSPWVNKPFLILLGLVLLIGMCVFLINNIYPLYLKENYHLPEAKIGIILALNGLLIIVFQMQMTSWLKNYKSLQIIGTGGFIIAIGYFILPFYHGFYYAALSMTLITLGEMIAIPFMYHHVMQISPSHMRGKYQGLVNCALMSLPLALTPNIASYVYITAGSRVLWNSVGLMGLLIFIGFEMLSRQDSKIILAQT